MKALRVLVVTLGLVALCAPASVAQNVLLMTDDVAAADVDAYRTALTAAGVAWSERIMTAGAPFPTAGELAPYMVLIWADEGTLGPGDAECQIVADWLQLGGRRLFATSVDFVWDLQNGTPGAGEHNLYLLLGAPYVGDYAGTGITSLTGVASDPVGGSWSVTPMTIAGTADSNGDYMDEATCAEGLLYGAGGTGSNRAALCHYDPGTYRTVVLGINFHNGISNQADRNQLMTNVMAFFVPLPVELQGLSIE